MSTCATCNGEGYVLHFYERGPGDPPGNTRIKCPDCSHGDGFLIETRRPSRYCPLCGGAAYSDGTDEHSMLCVRFRALEERLTKLESGLVRATLERAATLLEDTAEEEAEDMENDRAIVLNQMAEEVRELAGGTLTDLMIPPHVELLINGEPAKVGRSIRKGDKFTIRKL